jgi:hypothetical protein
MTATARPTNRRGRHADAQQHRHRTRGHPLPGSPPLSSCARRSQKLPSAPYFSMAAERISAPRVSVATPRTHARTHAPARSSGNRSTESSAVAGTACEAIATPAQPSGRALGAPAGSRAQTGAALPVLPWSARARPVLRGGWRAGRRRGRIQPPWMRHLRRRLRCPARRGAGEACKGSRSPTGRTQPTALSGTLDSQSLDEGAADHEPRESGLKRRPRCIMMRALLMFALTSISHAAARIQSRACRGCSCNALPRTLRGNRGAREARGLTWA